MPQIALPQRCDRAAAEAILPELRAAIGSTPLVIDASGVEQIGQAMLQVLVSARMSDDSLRLIASPALCDAAELAGLSEMLFDEVAA